MRLANFLSSGCVQRAEEARLAAQAHAWPPERALRVIPQSTLNQRAVLCPQSDGSIDGYITLNVTNLSGFDVRLLKLKLVWEARWDADAGASGIVDMPFREQRVRAQSSEPIGVTLTGTWKRSARRCEGAEVSVLRGSMLTAQGVWDIWEPSIAISGQAFLPVEWAFAGPP